MSAIDLNALKGRLDDAHETAEKLYRELVDIAADACSLMRYDGGPDPAVGLIRTLNETNDQMDEVVNAIDRQRTALRGS